MAIPTRLTELLGIEHPILLAPMGSASGGALAAAVTAAGGFGFIGSGYADSAKIRTEVAAAGNARIGVGLVTWRTDRRPWTPPWSTHRRRSCCRSATRRPMPGA